MGKAEINTLISLKERSGQFRFTLYFKIATHTFFNSSSHSSFYATLNHAVHWSKMTFQSLLLHQYPSLYHVWCLQEILSHILTVVTRQSHECWISNLNHVHAEQKVIHLGNGRLKKKSHTSSDNVHSSKSCVFLLDKVIY